MSPLVQMDSVEKHFGGVRAVDKVSLALNTSEIIGVLRHILFISHDMEDVFELCDRVMVMNRGREVGSHPITEVSKDDILSLIIKGGLPDNWTPRNVN